MEYIEQIIRILHALLTPVIGGVAIYIAWQQWQTNRQKLNLERYDRRLRIYEEVTKILIIIQRDTNTSINDLIKFRTSVSEADFLFGQEITKYIGEIYKHGLAFVRWNREYHDSTQAHPEGYDHQKAVSEMQKEGEWLFEQFGSAKEKFKKYLDISK